jgi:hypothetical protein
MKQRRQPEPLPPPKPLLEQIFDEINGGPFSIMSEAAKTRIKDIARIAMEDGYKRGYEAGYDKAATEAAEDAAGEDL